MKKNADAEALLPTDFDISSRAWDALYGAMQAEFDAAPPPFLVTSRLVAIAIDAYDRMSASDRRAVVLNNCLRLTREIMLDTRNHQP